MHCDVPSATLLGARGSHAACGAVRCLTVHRSPQPPRQDSCTYGILHIRTVSVQEYNNVHALCSLCRTGSALYRGTARVATPWDVDRLLPAVLSPPCDCLPLPGLCPGGSAAPATAKAPPYRRNDLTTPEQDKVAGGRRLTICPLPAAGPYPYRRRGKRAKSAWEIPCARCAGPSTPGRVRRAW
jgi:hypothetical protein